MYFILQELACKIRSWAVHKPLEGCLSNQIGFALYARQGPSLLIHAELQNTNMMQARKRSILIFIEDIFRCVAARRSLKQAQGDSTVFTPFVGILHTVLAEELKGFHWSRHLLSLRGDLLFFISFSICVCL
ncbi:unnamed protein product [Victoria cruziana]